MTCVPKKTVLKEMAAEIMFSHHSYSTLTTLEARRPLETICSVCQHCCEMAHKATISWDIMSGSATVNELAVM
jgi:hypothetical protein